MTPAYLLFMELLFDLDGTLWDTSEACAIGWNQALTELGVAFRPLTAQDIGRVMGLAGDELFARLLPDLSVEQHRALAPLCYEREEESIRRLGGRLYPGVVEAVPALAARHPLALVSNCQRGYIEMFLELQGWQSLFADFECYGNTGRPKADNLRQVIARNGWCSAVYIGDTRGDEAAARAAGVPYFHVDYGFGDCEKPARRLTSLTVLL